jgi:hypothetical protein
MGLNISQNSAIESNHKYGSNLNSCTSPGQGLTTNQFSHSAEKFGRSAYASGQVPEYSPYPSPMPSITSEAKPWETVGASRRNVEPNDDSHPPHLHCQCLAICQSYNTVCLGTSLFSSSSIFIYLKLGVHWQALPV